jgi:hypothetical protein
MNGPRELEVRTEKDKEGKKEEGWDAISVN